MASGVVVGRLSGRPKGRLFEKVMDAMLRGSGNKKEQNRRGGEVEKFFHSGGRGGQPHVRRYPDSRVYAGASPQR